MSQKSDERLAEFRRILSSEISLPNRLVIGSFELESIFPEKTFLVDSKRLPLNIYFFLSDGAGFVQFRFSVGSSDAMMTAWCSQVS